jgi:hypothetical protein
MLTKPRRKANNATGRLAERYELAGTWNSLKPARYGFYIRPGTDGKPRYYPWIEFAKEAGVKKYSNSAWAAMAPMLQRRQLNLKAVAPKVLEAFRESGKTHSHRDR